MGHVYHLTHRCHNRQFLLKYVELNMVRCGKVEHPRQWDWSGYSEMMGGRKRDRLLDMQKLLWLLRAPSLAEFQSNFNTAQENAMINDELQRQEKWTQSVAIGRQDFVDTIKGRIDCRRTLEVTEESGAWVLSETDGVISEAKNQPIDSLRGA